MKGEKMKIICEECKAEFETCDCFDRHGRKVIENLKKELAEMTSSRDFYKEENQSFGNVLAVIHRDGGHYITEHGHVKASRDAIKILYDKQKELAEANKEIDRLNKSLKDW
jgi:DNA mismatch repair ATPase MutS